MCVYTYECIINFTLNILFRLEREESKLENNFHSNNSDSSYQHQCNFDPLALQCFLNNVVSSLNII